MSMSDEEAMSYSAPSKSMSDEEAMTFSPKTSQATDSTQQPQGKSDFAMQSVSNPATSIPAGLTAYGANAISQIPGLKELGSAGAAVFGAGQGQTFGQRYNDLEASQAAMRKAGEQVNPGPTALGKISSNVLGLGLGGKLGGKVAETLPQSVSKFATAHPYLASEAVGVPTAAGYGFSQGDDTKSRLKSAGTSAAIASVLSPAATFASRNVVGPLAEKVGQKLGLTPTPPPPTTGADLRSQSSDAYKAAEKAGGLMTSNFTDNVINDAKLSITEPERVTKAFGKNPAQDIVDGIEREFKGTPMTLDEATSIDKRFTRAINEHILPNGKLDETGHQIFDMQTNFRQSIGDAADKGQISGGRDGVDAWKKAQELWAKSARVSDIERIISKGESMDVPATSIRSGFRTLLNNPSRMRGYSPEAQALIKKAAEAGLPQEALRALGSRLVSIVSLGHGNIPGALAAQGVSAASRGLAGNMQAQRGQAVIDQILGNAKPPLSFSPTSAAVVGSGAPYGLGNFLNNNSSYINNNQR
jgi:hypothetical protein